MSVDVLRVRDERKPGHHWADNEVLDMHGRELGPYGYAVYMALGRHADNRSGKCTKSQSDIAKIFGISSDTVQRAIQKLIDLGLLAKEYNPGGACEYILLEVDKQRIVPRGQNDLPLTAVPPAAHSGTHLPLTAAPLPLTAAPPTAHSGTPTAHSGTPIRKQDSLQNFSQNSSQSATSAKASLNGKVDPRFEQLKLSICFWYRTAFEVGSCPWTKRDDRALKSFLEVLPEDWTVAMLEKCVVHWAYSKRSAPEMPYVFVPRLLHYGESPRDQYDNPDYTERGRCAQMLAQRGAQ
jgi:DNA-binding MarR family transcriptional regulator